MPKQTLKFATFTGQNVRFLTPGRTEVVWDDLMFALGNEVRFGGHVPWTVLQHTGLVVKLAIAEGCTKEELAYAAAHDLHEAYVGDVPAPLKEVLPEFQLIEDSWMKHVHESLKLKWPVPAHIEDVVKEIDYRALVIEAKRFSYSLAAELEEKWGKVTAKDQKIIDFISTLNVNDLTTLIRMTLAGAGCGLAVDGDLRSRRCRWTKSFNYTVTGSNGITVYVVRWDGNQDWACTCPQYVHRNKRCKHINEVAQKQCDWTQDTHGGAALAPNFTCPKCSGETVL